MAKIPAYDGKEKFAFVSYSHRDSGKVYPIIETLINMGYNIWYDEGIPLVVDYGGVLYRKIKECSAFLLFVSEHSVKSEDVDKEVRNALSLKKPVVRINIDSSPIPDAWAYHLPATVNWIPITAEPSEFYGKVCAALTECRQSGQEAEEKKKAEKAEDVRLEEAVTAGTEQTPQEIVKKTTDKNKSSFARRIGILTAVAVLTLVVLAGAIVPAVLDSQAYEVDADTHVVSHSSEPSDGFEAVAETVSPDNSDGAPNEADNFISEPEAPEVIPDEVVIGGKTLKTSAKEVDLSGTGVSDISSLRYFSNLEKLDISYDGKDGSFYYQNRNKLSDLTPLADLRKLKTLHLWGNSISDITPLAGLTELTELDLKANYIRDITPLAGLTELTYLYLYYNNISDITPLAGLTELTDLNLGDNNISDITPLAGLTELTYLNLGGNNISDITPLAVLTELTYLSLCYNNISDIEPLKNLTKLEYLFLDSADFTAAQKAELEAELEAALPNCKINWV